MKPSEVEIERRIERETQKCIDEQGERGREQDESSNNTIVWITKPSFDGNQMLVENAIKQFVCGAVLEHVNVHYPTATEHSQYIDQIYN